MIYNLLKNIFLIFIFSSFLNLFFLIIVGLLNNYRIIKNKKFKMIMKNKKNICNYYI